jgi:hypothetical protein
MAGMSKNILLLSFIIAFLTIILAAVNTMSVTANANANANAKAMEGFSTQFAKDCSCDPGFVPQLCGDSMNIFEKMGGPCIKDTYFCQNLRSATLRDKCRHR